MGHGWPQSFAVSIMRRVRLDLEREHARILRQRPDKLFDQQAIRAKARPGDIAVDNTDPVFLTVASKAQRAPDEAQTAPLSAVCREREGQQIQSRCGRLECDYVRGCNARPQATPRVDENGTTGVEAEGSTSSAQGRFSRNPTIMTLLCFQLKPMLGLQMCRAIPAGRPGSRNKVTHFGGKGSVSAVSKRVHSEIKSKSKSVTSAPAPRLRLFGPPPLLEGEDAAAYDELLARICAAVKPVDIIDEMFIADVVSLEWEVLRWRRLKSSLIRARGLKALEGFLA